MPPNENVLPPAKADPNGFGAAPLAIPFPFPLPLPPPPPPPKIEVVGVGVVGVRRQRRASDQQQAQQHRFLRTLAAQLHAQRSRAMLAQATRACARRDSRGSRGRVGTQ